MAYDNGVKVLVVDDDEWICYYLTRFLSRNGYQAITAKSGIEAVDLAKAHHPQIILLDIVMPDIDGLETIRRLREADERGVVIIITGHTDPKNARDAMHLGAFEYISKPFSLNALKSALRNGLREFDEERLDVNVERDVIEPATPEVRTLLAETGTMRVELIEQPRKVPVPRRRKRLLLVDGSEQVILKMTEELTARGYEILGATSCERATQILLRKESRPEIVLVDVALSNLHGGQFCRFIKTNGLFGDVRVILCGELQTEELLALAREFGADAWVSKQELFRTWRLPEPLSQPLQRFA